MQTPLHFFTGFLGSGKTTMVNSLLAGLGQRKIGLVLNDFGSVCVDAGLVEGGDSLKISTLAGGQIFCSCLSGSFAKTVLSYRELGLDAILIEASGLAKPNALFEIVDEIERQAGGSLRYGSTSCIVDATSFELLMPVVNVLAEQVRFSDRVFLSKLDLVGSDAKDRLLDLIGQIAPGKPVLATDHGKVGWDAMTIVKRGREYGDPAVFRTWGAFGRPQSGTIEFTRTPSSEDVARFLEQIRHQVLRAKGSVLTSDKGVVFCEVAAGRVSVGERRGSATTVLTVIRKADSPLQADALESGAAAVRWN